MSTYSSHSPTAPDTNPVEAIPIEAIVSKISPVVRRSGKTIDLNSEERYRMALLNSHKRHYRTSSTSQTKQGTLPFHNCRDVCQRSDAEVHGNALNHSTSAS